MTGIFSACTMTLTGTVACTLALLAPLVAEGQNLTDRDAKEIADYVLTEAVLKKYTQAIRNLQPFMGQVPQDCDDEHPKSHSGVSERHCAGGSPGNNFHVQV